MITGIIKNEKLRYPSVDTAFSPSEPYPEYPFAGGLASTKNTVYEAVRNLLINLRLDEKNIGTPKWNPLGEYINKEAKVFVLCNFVYHRKPYETEEEFFSKCTHGSVLRPIIDYIIIAAGKSSSISFGNAPLQSCNWEKVIKDTHADELVKFYASEKIKVEAKDLRMTVSERDFLGNIISEKTSNTGGVVEVNLDDASFLRKVSEARDIPRYRVLDYNPDKTEQYQNLNKHRYLINKNILESDVIFSVPKLKTHEKVGVTLGIKGMVGIVGHKDCLAHHRSGAPELGGDEYPDSNVIREWYSSFHDFVQRRQYHFLLRSFFYVLDTNFSRIIRRLMGGVAAGSWHGNDTAWRMALDLTKIAHFSDSNGVMCPEEKRKHLVLIDAIIGGEGEGPLSPRPVHTKAIIFSDNLFAGDYISAQIMKTDPNRIPLIYNAFGFLNHASKGLPEGQAVNFNGKDLNILEVKNKFTKKYELSKGWIGHA